MPTLASVYLQFLDSPTTAPLASDATLSYITTTTTIREPTAIIKHFTVQNRQVVKKEQKVLNVIESGNSSCVETLTTVQFRMGGGAFLPGMDANLIDEREVTFPLTHIVTFSADNKIVQARLYWDQATLLRQVDAIGKSGRNWPIRDGRAQGDLIVASVKAGGSSTPANSGSTATQNLPIREGSKRDSVSVVKDPHASLSLFEDRGYAESEYQGPTHETRGSSKPPPREYGELFVSGEGIPGPNGRNSSPHKNDGTGLKAGAGKNYRDNRLFDETEEPANPLSPERKKTYEQKYDHFAFGNGEDAKENRPTTGRSKASVHSASFSFEDFATPIKVQEKHRPGYDRQWGPEDDADVPSSPPKRPVVHAARPDSKPQFELSDASPAIAATKSLQGQKGMGLYQDPINADPRAALKGPKLVPSDAPKPSVAAPISNTRRGDAFDAHYTMTDASPAADPAARKADKRGVRSGLTASWGFDDPVKTERKIYKTAGDGMGSRAGARSWGIGDDSDPEADVAVRPTARSSKRSEHDRSEDLDF